MMQTNVIIRMLKECGRTLQDSSGEFGWPVQDSDAENAASSVKVAEPCQWRISGTHGERIVVNISELRLASTDCVTDYLEVRDGHWYRSPLLGQHTGLLSLTDVK